MLKRILALLMALILCFSFVGCGEDKDIKDSEKHDDKETTQKVQSDDSDDISPLLYKVTDNEGNVVWLFGSIHVGRDDFYPLPEYVIEAFDNADSLAVEFDIVAFEKDTKAQIEAMTKLVLTDGSKISDYINSDIYDAAVEILKEEKLYNSYMDMYVPALWSSLIDNFVYEIMKVDIDGGIDRHLINRAMDKNKEILDVESAEFQYGMMADFSYPLQEYLLAMSIQKYDMVSNWFGKKVYQKQLDKLMDLWAKGREKELAKYLTEEEFRSEEEKTLYDEYNNALIAKRNINMTDYAEEALKSGKEVFICVGAAHVVGDGAMAQLLKERGYTVKIVK